MIRLLLPALLLTACNDDTDTKAEDVPLETLAQEPAGSPTDASDGRMACLGNNEPAAPAGNAVELTGYIRTLADPDASGDPPAAEVEAFDADGNSLATAFADPSKDGRVAITVPVTDAGFTGHVVVRQAGYLDWYFHPSRGITSPELNGWAFLATQAEADAQAQAVGASLLAGKGVLLGSVHDCDAFGISNALVTVEGEAAGVYYIDGFDASSGRSYTGISGRWVLPNVAPGSVTIKAWARLEAGGPLTLVSETDTTVVADALNAVSLDPY